MLQSGDMIDQAHSDEEWGQWYRSMGDAAATTDATTTSAAPTVPAEVLDKAAADYKAYAQRNIDELQRVVKVFTDAVRAGDLTAAQEAYAPSRAPWERIEPIAGLVEDAFRKDFELPLYRLTAEGRALAEERRDTGKADVKAWKTLKDRLNLTTSRTDLSERTINTLSVTREAALHRLEHAHPLQTSRVKHPVGDIWPEKLRHDGMTA